MSRASEFLEEYQKRAGKLPEVENYPDFPEPPAPPPDITLRPAQMEDYDLAMKLDGWIAWHNFMESNTGKFAALEAAYKQDLARVENEVYLEYHNTGKFQGLNVEHKKKLAEADERVQESKRYLVHAQQGKERSKAEAEVYRNMAIRYSSERQNRRSPITGEGAEA